MPDILLYPTGGGTGLVGIPKGYEELRSMGWLSGHLPRLFAVQAEGCAPVVKAFAEGAETTTAWENPTTHAAGLRVPSPFAGRQMLRLLRETRGGAVAVSEKAIQEAQRLVARTEGIWTAPESAARVAALGQLKDRGHAGPAAEAMLFAAGAVTRLGRVDDGSTTTDFDPDEIRRKISINTSIAYCDWKGHHINLVDTPGYGDFIADARAGLRVVEAAIVVVDAVAGVQVQTEKVWKFATEYNLPRAVVVNRLDRERADFFRTFESLGKRLKGRLVALHLPIGEESSFPGFVDLVKMKAVTLTGNKPAEGEIPAELADRAKEYREKLVEAAAETDDDLLAKYLEEGSLGEPEMLKALRAGIAAGKLMPVMCAAASKSIGVHALLDLIVDSLPSPADRQEIEGTDLKTKQPATRTADAKAPVTALVFKTLSDPHIGKLSLFRVMTGTLRADSTLLNPGRGARERMGHVSWLQGKTQKNVETLGAGEIGVRSEERRVGK